MMADKAKRGDVRNSSVESCESMQECESNERLR